MNVQNPETKSHRVMWGLIIGALATLVIMATGISIFDLPKAFGETTTASAAKPFTHGNKRVCHPSPPEYIGCSVQQAATAEAPNLATFKSNKKKNRWDQGVWVQRTQNQRPRAWENMRVAYLQMVNRSSKTCAARTGKTVSSCKAARTLTNWTQFTARSDCFVPGSAMPFGWCMFTDKVIDPISNGGVRITESCDEAMLTVAVGGAIATTVKVMLAEASAAAIAGAGVTCMVNNAYTWIKSSIFGKAGGHQKLA